MTWRPLPVPRADREPQRLAPSLERIAASLGAPAPDLLRAVFTGWADLVGPDVAAHATPRSLRDGVLTVSVDHPAWATSLRMLSADLLARIASEGGGEVGELVVHVDTGGGRPAGRAGGSWAGRRSGGDGAESSGVPRRRGRPAPSGSDGAADPARRRSR